MVRQIRFCIVLLFVFSSLFPIGVYAEEGLQDQQTDAVRRLVIKGEQQQPVWMKLWEQARSAVAKGDTTGAVIFYQRMLEQKPDIEEALREYALVLIDAEQWKVAETTLQHLLEINPRSTEYLFYAGQVLVQLKQYNRAATYLGQVYVSDPNGEHAITALRGQIEALQQQSRWQLAYPLMEQLYLLVPHEEQNIRELAQYSAKLGHSSKAMAYYTTLLGEFTPKDTDYFESEPLFAQAKNYVMAERCWLGYLHFHTYYLPYHQKLADFYLKSKERVRALPHLLVLIARGDENPDIFLETGKLYLYAKGRPDKALYYYDEYRKRIPANDGVEKEIARIQAILANDLLTIVENEGAWNLWRDLAKVIPDRLAVYYSMASQLKELGKSKELREVLEIIHLHNPGDQKVIIQLAQLTFAMHDYEATRTVLDSLDENRKKGIVYYFLRAKLCEIAEELTCALNYYVLLLDSGENDLETILHMMKLAGTIGNIAQLDHIYSRVERTNKSEQLLNQVRLLYGQILFENGLLSKANRFYLRFFKMVPGNSFLQQIIQEYIAHIEREKEHYFTAEQKYRYLFIKGHNQEKYLSELVKNSIEAKDWNNAWKWHELRTDTTTHSGTTFSSETRDLFIEKERILFSSGHGDLAVELAEEFLQRHPLEDSVKVVLAEFLFKNREYSEALETIKTVTKLQPEEYLLYELIEKNVGRIHPTILSHATSLSNLIRARQFNKYGENTKALRNIEKYLQQYPSAVGAKILKANILQSLGKDREALVIYSELSKRFPGEDFFRERLLKIQFKIAKFDDIITAYGDIPLEELSKTARLLLARSFWAENSHLKARTVYSSLLADPVDEQFAEAIAEQNIVLQIPAPKRTVLNRLTFTQPAEPDRLDFVMEPFFIKDNKNKSISRIVTDYYAEYRWQNFIQEELSVRQEMDEGNYYQAMKEYQKMLHNNPSMESLYDLAGIYSRLGLLGREAALYEIMQEESPGYPYLDQAMQRNKLKRKPRLSLFYEQMKKDGHDGYFDIKQQGAGVDFWWMPTLEHQITFTYHKLFDESYDERFDLWRNRVQSEYHWSPQYDFDFLARVGIDDGEDTEKTIFLYEVQLNGKLGDTVKGYFDLSQDVVDDTIESLQEGIYATKYEGGVQLDLLTRFFAGWKYAYTGYSDSNYQNKYNLWSSYILNHEPLLLQLRYEYELSHSNEANKKREFAINNNYVAGDHPYWIQKEYWLHSVSLLFEHQLTDDILGRGAPSYYSLNYTFGYEEGGYDNHQFKAEFFLEMSRHFLLNSSFEYFLGSDYKELHSNLSLIYRW